MPSQFWSDRTPPSAGLRPGSAGRPGSSGRGSGGFSVPHAAAAAAAATAAGGGDSGGDAEGVRRSSRQTARRDAQAAAVLQDFAGGLLSAAEQLRTPNPPTLPPPPQPTELQPGWGAQAPTAAEMQHWRHEWRQRHPQEAGSEERRHAASPRPGATSPGLYQAQQAQHAPMLQSVTHQLMQQCTVQLAVHQQQAVLHPAQPHGPGQLPLFVGGGSISPRNPEPVPAAIAAAVAAAQAAAAGAAPPLPGQQLALQMPAFEFAAPLPLSTMQQLPQAATATAHEARHAAEAAAAAAARSALPPFTFAAPPQPAVVPAASPASYTGPGVAVPVTAVASAPPQPPDQLPAELAAEPASPEGPGVAVPIATAAAASVPAAAAAAAAGGAGPSSPAGPGVAVPVAAVQEAPVPPLWQPMAAQLAPLGPLPILAMQPPPPLRQQQPPDPTTPHSGTKMPKPQVPAQPSQRQAPAGSN